MSCAPRCVATFGLALVLGAGCLTPPVLLDAREVDLAEALKKYPSGSEEAAIDIEPGVALRGIFVPSQRDAPIVLHLLESSGSAGSKAWHFGPVTGQLADLGYASLIVDYSGVGLSSGDRSATHLGRDALAMWNEAVRRADGDARRVHVRATSLGTIACALLLKHGVRPASMVWIAPVLPDSVTSRFAHAFHGPLEGVAASALFRDVADVDVFAVLTEARVPGLVLASPSDPLLTDRERDLLGAALEPAAHLLPRDGGHVQLSLEAHGLLREEMQIFVPCTSPEAARTRSAAVLAALPPDVAARFASGTPERERLERLCVLQRGEPAESVAAAALSIPRAAIAARLLSRLAWRPYRSLDFDEQCAVLSLDDPAGELPIDLIEHASWPSDLVQQFGGMRLILDAPKIAAAAFGGGVKASHANWETSVSVSGVPRITIGVDARAVFQALLDRGIPTPDAERQFIRILLKSHRIPDRLALNAEGRPVIEVKSEDAWSALELSPKTIESGTIKFSGSGLLK